ncbi:hypothetical protein PM082_022765 [Marasmius tenuissimus]|nr:hypothetical protein PM082_022765 [Marasmius tenuissimus]
MHSGHPIALNPYASGIHAKVYALYAKSRFMATFLVLAFVGRKAAIIRISSPHDKFSEYRDPFLHTCVPAIRDDLHIHILIFVLMELGLHAIWCGLTLLKTWSLRDVWTSYPTQNFSPVLNRDALLVYMAIVGVFVSILVGTFKAKATDIITFCAFPALVSVTSRSGCRVIIHLQRLPGTEDPEKDSGDQAIFSTIDLTGDTRACSA